MNKQSKYLFIISLAALVLSGCAGSTVTGEWSCPVDQPEGCFSVVDGDRIALSEIKTRNTPPFRGGILDTEITPDETPPKPSVMHDLTNGLVDTPRPRTSSVDNKVLHAQRIPEELAEIWVGSFVDAGGNFHPAGTIYIVVRPAQWRAEQ